MCIYTYVSCVQPTIIIQEYPEKPDVSWMSLSQWKTCCQMEELLPVFKGICTDIVTTPVHCTVGRLEVCRKYA